MGFEYKTMIGESVKPIHPNTNYTLPPGKMKDLLLLFNHAYLWLFLYPSAKKSKALEEITSRLAPHTTDTEKVQEISTNSKYL